MLLFVTFLGVVQGATEFLPVSSSGHLFLLENLKVFDAYTAELTGGISLLAFNIILHLGTLLAVVFYWRADIAAITMQVFSDLGSKRWQGAGMRKLGLAVIATLPAGLVPLFKDEVEKGAGSALWIGIFFLVNGLMLIAVDFFVLRKRDDEGARADFGAMPWWQALCIGCLQVVAVLPGISRSGATISGGLLVGLKSSEAVRFSFLISIPIMLAASLLELKGLSAEPLTAQSLNWPWIATGFVASFLSGLLALRLLVWLAARLTFYPFGIYTISLFILIFLFLR